MLCQDFASPEKKSSSDSVVYVGPNLPGSGVNTCNDLTLIIQKLDNKIIQLQNEIYRTTTTSTTTTFNPITTTTTTTTVAPTTTTTSSTTSTTTSTTSTTTTQTPAVCKSFTLLAVSTGASWTAQTCEDDIVGGLVLIPGTVVETGCILDNTLELYGLTISSETLCP